MRVFLSYDISDPIFLAKVEHLQSALKGTGADPEARQPKNHAFHDPLSGEIEKSDKDEIVKALQGKVENFELDLAFKGVGAFPDDRRISVIWIGIDLSSATALERKANEINALIRSIPGLSGQKEQSFSPHVTISRVRSGRNKEKLTEFLRQHGHDDFGTTKISVLRLKLSELTPAGPEYSDLHVFEREKPAA